MRTACSSPHFRIPQRNVAAAPDLRGRGSARQSEHRRDPERVVMPAAPAAGGRAEGVERTGIEPVTSGLQSP
jgi:hypothetical protein